MNCKSIGAVLLSSLFLTAAPVSAEGRLTLVLFGAQWCAPCRTELRELSSLAQAAAPARLQLAWIDRRPAVPASDAWTVLAPEEARRLLESQEAPARGLPVAILFDGGRACVQWRGPVTVAEIGRLKDACR